jgi:hypothetical protein
MKTHKRLTVSGILILAAVTTFALAAAIALAQETDARENISELLGPEETEAVASALPIQGRLTDADGNPLSGGYSVRAGIYDARTGGTELCSDTDTVMVEDGLFIMYLDGTNGCSSSDIDGKQLYLGITVGSDPEMTPRQGIYPVPYAWSLRPGATISGTINGAILHIENWNTSGRALRAYAMATSGENYGVVGASRSSNGYGGYFYNTAAGDGVKGEGWFGVYGSGTSQGVHGDSDSGYGVFAYSTDGIGVGAATNDSSHNYGVFTVDNLYSLNYHSSGAQMQVVQNGGLTPLETGDVAAFSGIGAPLEAGGSPVIQVTSADSANSTAVAGVVYSRYNIENLRAGPEKVVPDVTPEGAAAPGDYLLVVIQGPAQVKASALAGPLQPGDLLSSASQVGYAAKATQVTLNGIETAMPGTILGKVLEALEEGEELIYIFVTLQ